MQHYVNGRLEFSSLMSFDNGWSIAINQLPCGHSAVLIMPAYIAETPELSVKLCKDNPYYNRDVMIERGDYYAHYEGDDDALLDIIVSVACREVEPHLAKINQDIMKAVKA
jgi:hypothetical protein